MSWQEAPLHRAEAARVHGGGITTRPPSATTRTTAARGWKAAPTRSGTTACSCAEAPFAWPLNQKARAHGCALYLLRASKWRDPAPADTRSAERIRTLPPDGGPT
eukprot:12855911-Alexandrium_andersonii.AAC.1